MIPPSLDFTSELFDPYKALHNNKVPLPYPKAKTYNNIAEYYSHTFLKKGFESNKSAKNQEKPRERNYEWYYDTLGLSECQRNYIRSNKKIKRRKGKKPISIVTIPGSPLRSEKVTVCKSDFKEYCRRKFRSLNTTSTITNIKSKEFETFPSNSTSESSFLSSVTNTDSASALPFIKRETVEFLPTSLNSTKTKYPSSSFHTVNSESLIALHFTKTELPSCTEKPELSDSSDSFSDNVLILKMKSNLQKACTLKKEYESPVSFQIKQKTLELSSNRLIDSKHNHDSHQANNKTLSKISNPGYPYSSNDHAINAINDMKSNNSEIMPLSRVKDSSTTVNSQKKSDKKHELRPQGDPKTSQHKKKQKYVEIKDDSSDTLDCGRSQKSAAQNNLCEKKHTVCKENSSVIDSKSNIQRVKKRKKSALKSQENMLDCKKSTAIVDSKSNDIMSKIKTENSPVVNHCACKFPCGLSHLCTCGYYANAKEALSKFKIPRKKK